jgi:hypothetical protein
VSDSPQPATCPCGKLDYDDDGRPCVFCGGYRSPAGEVPRLTPEEVAELERLYAEFLEDIAKGNARGLRPEEDR